MEVIPSSRLSDLAFKKGLAELVLNGSIICYPTDTCYAIGANALKEDSVYRIFIIKDRDLSKPLPVIVRDIPTASRFCVLDEKAKKLFESFPGISLVLPKTNIPNIVNPSKIMIRIPDNEVVQSFLKYFPVPLVSTSANKSGDPNPYKVEEIMNSLSNRLSMIQFIIDAGELPKVRPSTIMDCIDGKVYREGKYSKKEVLEVFNEAD